MKVLVIVTALFVLGCRGELAEQSSDEDTSALEDTGKATAEPAARPTSPVQVFLQRIPSSLQAKHLPPEDELTPDIIHVKLPDGKNAFWTVNTWSTEALAKKRMQGHTLEGGRLAESVVATTGAHGSERLLFRARIGTSIMKGGISRHELIALRDALRADEFWAEQ